MVTVRVTTRTGVRDDGSVWHKIDFVREADDVDESAPTSTEDYICDEIIVQQYPDSPERLVCACYDSDECVWQGVFEARELTFDPISLLGRGESRRLLGVEASEDEPPAMAADSVGVGTLDEQARAGNPPVQVRTALQSLGMTVVPQGTWWLDTP